MEIKINIAAILKDKPQGTKLYDWLHNIDVELDTISTTDTETVVWCTNETDNNTTCHRGYSEFGTVRGYPDGLQILFPSKDMRDWSKFTWKRENVLISDCGFVCIFKEWASDDYTRFNGCYFDGMPNAETAKYSKLDNNTAYGYIRELEKRCGGVLNLKTLKIEKPEFKDGDVLFVKCNDSAFIEIFEYSKKNGDLCDHASLDTTNQFLDISGKCIIRKDEITELRLATEEEKKQFFSALAKKGKAWDAEKKAIVDLKPKCKFKPFDKVVVRDTEYSTWCADLFSHIDVDYRYACVGATWNFCIPYNEETAHLLGTTDDWEGGEQ